MLVNIKPCLINRESCKGCSTHENNICLINPLTIRRGIEKMCPCIECLIKGMCTSECEEYIIYGKFIGSNVSSRLCNKT